MRHISSPKDKTRIYRRQTTPYPEEISESTLERESNLSARYREGQNEERIHEEDDEGNGVRKQERWNTRSGYEDDGEERKVQFREGGGEEDYSRRPSTEPSRRKESFKTRRQTPFTHEIEASNELSEQLEQPEDHQQYHGGGEGAGGEGRSFQKSFSESEISSKKKSFQKRKNTPFPHEMEEEIQKSARYSSRTSISEEDEGEGKGGGHDNHDHLPHGDTSPDDRDPIFDSVRRNQHKGKEPKNHLLFADLDHNELQPPHSASSSARHHISGSHFDGSQTAPTSLRQSDSFSNHSTGSNSSSQRVVRLRPLTPEGHFRREYSKDHPLAGGKGKYNEEVMVKGKEWMGPQATLIKKNQQQHPKKKITTTMTQKRPLRISEIVSNQEQKKLDLQRQLEELRKHQNEVLLEVLDEERKAEQERVEMGRGIADHEERKRYVDTH
jgi:hypothetical protein